MLVIAIQKTRAVERAHLKAILQKSAARPFTIHFNSSLQTAIVAARIHAYTELPNKVSKV
jgi:hypothetical protein